MTHFIIIVLMFITGFWAYQAIGQDGTLNITPGMYKITGTTKTNLDEKPNIKSSEVCIQQSQIRPEDMLGGKDACTINNLKQSEDKVSFDLECKGPDSDSTLKGKAEYSTTPQSFKFKYNLKGVRAGSDLSVDSEGSAERTGDCP